MQQLELMRRKQSMQHFDQRQLLLLENAYYQVRPGNSPLSCDPYASLNSAILLNVPLDKRKSAQ
jgi:hypothetical protein